MDTKPLHTSVQASTVQKPDALSAKKEEKPAQKKEKVPGKQKLIPAGILEVSLPQKRIQDRFTLTTTEEQQSLKWELSHLMSSYNTQVCEEFSKEKGSDEKLVKQIHAAYDSTSQSKSILSKILAHASLQSIPENIQDFDKAILSFIEHQRHCNFKERSLLISRAFCWLVKEKTQLTLLEGYGHILSGADLAYMARHSSLLVADSILDTHIERIPAPAIAEIAKAHPCILGAYIFVRRCFQSEDEWPFLLQACHHDLQLAELIQKEYFLKLPYFTMRHLAALGCCHQHIAGDVFDDLMGRLNDNNNSDTKYHHQWNEDDIAAWILLLKYKQWAIDNCVTMPFIEKQFPADAVAIIKADIISRHHSSGSSYIRDVITKQNLYDILQYSSAKKLLLRSPPPMFFNHLKEFAPYLSDDDKKVFLENCPQFAMLITSSLSLRSGNSLAQIADTFPDSAGQAYQIFFNLLPKTSRDYLLKHMKNPSSHALMRRTGGNQFRQIQPPYRDTREWIHSFIKNKFKAGENLSPWLIYNLAFSYPCLTKVLMNANEMAFRNTPISNASLEEAEYFTYSPIPEVCLYLLRCRDLNDKTKLSLASLHQDILDILIVDSENFLKEPNLLFRDANLFNHLIKSRHTQNTIKALEYGFLAHLNSSELYHLCMEHEDFALSLVSYPEILNTLTHNHLADLCSRQELFSNTVRDENPALWKEAKKHLDVMKEQPKAAVSIAPMTPAFQERDNTPLTVLETLLNQGFGWLQMTGERYPPPLPLTCNWSSSAFKELYLSRAPSTHLSHGLNLDFVRWHYKHPERHPSLYIQKLEGYSTRQYTPTSRATGNLPERVRFYADNLEQFMAEGIPVSGETTLNAKNKITVPSVDEFALPDIFKYMQKTGALVISRATHSCTALIWNAPEDTNNHLVFFDSKTGLTCRTIEPFDEDNPCKLYRWLKDSIENHLLRYGMDEEIMAHTIHIDRLANTTATPYSHTYS